MTAMNLYEERASAVPKKKIVGCVLLQVLQNRVTKFGVFDSFREIQTLDFGNFLVEFGFGAKVGGAERLPSAFELERLIEFKRNEH